MSEWRLFHRLEADEPEGDAPPEPGPYWVLERFYFGVVVGEWTGERFTVGGSDDCFVSHWMPLQKPNPLRDA